MTNNFFKLSLENQIRYLDKHGSFEIDIRYYSFKINLYLLEGRFFEVFIDHKTLVITAIYPLDYYSSRLDFYLDQIKLPIAS